MCQLEDGESSHLVAVHVPNVFPQVKFDAKDDYGYNANYNILQKALKTQGIDKVIRPDALMRGKPLDNLEFIQWLKHYCTNTSSGDVPRPSI